MQLPPQHHPCPTGWPRRGGQRGSPRWGARGGRPHPHRSVKALAGRAARSPQGGGRDGRGGPCPTRTPPRGQRQRRAAGGRRGGGPEPAASFSAWRMGPGGARRCCYFFLLVPRGPSPSAAPRARPSPLSSLSSFLLTCPFFSPPPRSTGSPRLGPLWRAGGAPPRGRRPRARSSAALAAPRYRDHSTTGPESGRLRRRMDSSSQGRKVVAGRLGGALSWGGHGEGESHPTNGAQRGLGSGSYLQPMLREEALQRGVAQRHGGEELLDVLPPPPPRSPLPAGQGISAWGGQDPPSSPTAPWSRARGPGEPPTPRACPRGCPRTGARTSVWGHPRGGEQGGHFGGAPTHLTRSRRCR